MKYYQEKHLPVATSWIREVFFDFLDIDDDELTRLSGMAREILFSVLDSEVPTSMIQAYAAASMLIVSKVEGDGIKVAELWDVGNGAFDEETLRMVERRILAKLIKNGEISKLCVPC